jgi:K+-sensing histidine kinase KdpD
MTKHDLRAPINMIAGTCDEIQKGIASFQQKNRRLHGEAELVPSYRFHDLNLAVASLRNLEMRLEADPREIQLEIKKTFLEGDLIAHNSAMLRYFAKKYHMSIRFGSFREIPPLFVDRDVIARVFHNLIVNAIKYGYPNTQIDVTPRVMHDGYSIEISNFGITIKPEESDRIFLPYYRSQEAEEKRMGAGLGLYIARAGMEQHNGRLTLVSNSNPVVFSMFFPLQLRWEWSPTPRVSK